MSAGERIDPWIGGSVDRWIGCLAVSRITSEHVQTDGPVYR